MNKAHYFKDYTAARLVLSDLQIFHPAARVVEFDRGYALQFHISGEYLTEAQELARKHGSTDWHKHKTCRYCNSK